MKDIRITEMRVYIVDRGDDGYTPIKGVDYFDGEQGIQGLPGEDGYTPIKGVDYFDGIDGKDGKDGYTPIKGIDYFDGEKGEKGTDGKDGYTPVKGVDYFDGKDGKDGYTPIKGIDYFDGEKGDKGDPGKDGSEVTKDKIIKELGYTPVDSKEITSHISDNLNPHKVTKSQIGLGKVDNTSDMDKPVSNAMKSELDKKLAYGNTILYSERVKIIDTRDINDTPLNVMSSGKPSLKFDFKRRTVVGNPDLDISANGLYAHILTVYGWADNTGGYPTQISFGKEKVGIRTGISNEEWSEWRVHSSDSDIFKKVQELLNKKADKTEIPTKVSQLTNDTKFITLAEVPKTDLTQINNDINTLKIAKADKNYVDIELNKKADVTSVPIKLSELNKDINFDERYYTETETDNLLGNKVDNSRVLSDVPANAKFTDTTYDVATASTNGLMSATDKQNVDSNTGARHTHTNKVVIDKFSDVGGKPYYNGNAIGGAVPNLTLNELTLGDRFKISYNDIEDSLDIEVI